MSKPYTLLIVIYMLTLLTCVSSAQNLPPPGSQSATARDFPHSKWTVLVYMSADNELDKYAMRNIHAMEAAAPPRDDAHAGVTILVQLDRCSKNTTPASWTDTRRYHLVRDQRLARLFARVKDQPPLAMPNAEHPDSPIYHLSGRIPNSLPMNAPVPLLPAKGMEQIRSPRLDAPPLGKLDMGDPDTLNDFIRWGQQTAPADHYLVYTWGHGNGWRLEDDALPDETGSTPVPAVQAKSFCDDDGYDPDGTSINSAQLSDALASTKHIDVLAMDNCMMAMFEVAYQVHQQVDYLTASEEEIPDCGFDYYDTLGALTRLHGDIAPAALARLIAANNQAAWQHYGLANTLTNSAIIVGKIPAAAHALHTLVQRLVALPERDNPALERAREECMEFGMVTDFDGAYDIIDLCDYLQRLIRYVPDDGVRREARAAEQAVHACVLANFASPPYDFAHGLSMYVPSSQTMTRKYLKTYGAFAFCHDTNWLQWLTKTP